MSEHGQDIAAVLVEPLAGNMGYVEPVPGFLEGLDLLLWGYFIEHGLELIVVQHLKLDSFHLTPNS